MFNDQQKNIIIGLMLGDGHLSLKGKAKNASLIVRRAQHDIEYSRYHVDIFGDHVTESGLKSKTRFDSRTNKNYYYCNYSLKASEELTQIYNKWYENKRKIIPKDLQLNGEIIATWLCDDGWVRKSKNGYIEIGFATNCFLPKEVEHLRSLLAERYQVRVGVCKCKNKQMTLHLSDYAARKMIADIDPFFPQGMERKRKWSGLAFGKEHGSHAESSLNKKNKVEEFINNNNNFYLIDVTKYAGSQINRTDGRLEWDTQNIKRYLQKYLKQGIIKFDYKDHKGSHYSK